MSKIKHSKRSRCQSGIRRHGNYRKLRLEELEQRLVLASASPSTGVFDLSCLQNPGDGTAGVTFLAVENSDESGSAVDIIGDMNGDGFDDVLIGAGAADGAGNAKTSAGESYVVFGKPDWSATPTLDLATLDGTNGFTLFGVDAFDYSGWAVSGAGDVNGDGFIDLMIGSVTGKSYVVFGKPDWSSTPTLDLDALDGTNGFKLLGTNLSVSGAGDVNGDGFDDLLGGKDSEVSVESYVVFGRADWSGTATLHVDTLNGNNGFILLGGFSGRGAGDVNGDGFDDVVGSKYSENPGEFYVVFGNADWSASPALDLANLNGGNGFTLFGEDPGFVAESDAGDVNGDGYDDVIIGGFGLLTVGKSYVVFGKDDWLVPEPVFVRPPKPEFHHLPLGLPIFPSMSLGV